MKTKLGLVGLMGVTIAMFQNCSPAQIQFSGPVELASQVAPEEDHATEETPGSTPTEPGYQIVQKQKRFESASKEKMVDMVWVIDNSVSMKEEAAIIRTNFESFANSIASKTNLKVALISKKNAFSLNTHVAMPVGVTNGMQVDYLVHSFNPLLAAAASTCTNTPDTDDQFCNKNLTNPEYNNVRGSLLSFFREDSQKVFVFVTDDDTSMLSNTWIQHDSNSSTGHTNVGKNLEENMDFISSATFKNRMSRAFGENASFKVYGFAAIPGVSRCAARPSNEYINLIKEKKGEVYDLCQSDWKNNFAALSDKVVEYASNEYSLDSLSLHRITSVSVNGRILIPELEYTVEKDKIALKKELFASTGNYLIDATYEEKIPK